MQRKTPCQSYVKKEDLPEVEQGKPYVCKQCGHRFAFAPGLSLHLKKSCKAAVAPCSPEELIKLQRDLIDTQQKLLEFRTSAALAPVETMFPTAAPHNQTNVKGNVGQVAQRDAIGQQINVNFFGKEDTSYITQDMIREIMHEAQLSIKDPDLAAEQAFVALTMLIRSNRGKMENVNCYIPNMKHDFAMVYNENGWEKMPMSTVAPQVVKSTCDVLEKHQPDGSKAGDMECGPVTRYVFTNETKYKKGAEIRPVLARNRSLVLGEQ